jgi:hypothetical protein
MIFLTAFHEGGLVTFSLFRACIFCLPCKKVTMGCSVTQGTIRIVIMACSVTEGTFSRVIMACSVTQGTIHIVIMVCSVTERQNRTFFFGGGGGRYDEPRVALVETGHALSQREDLERIARPEGARPKAGAD